MRIVGFGDSFIQPVGHKIINEHHYMKLFSDFFENGSFKCFGVSGSGIWDAFFEFKKQAEHKYDNYDFDVCVFVWSEQSRLYTKSQRDISYSKSLEYSNSNDPFWMAIRYYYEHIFDSEKNEFEFTSFFYWLDEWLYVNYPKVKFIHMYSFPKKVESGHSNEYFKIIKNHPNKEVYFHKFKNSVTIIPSLLHLSLNDEWPENNDLSNERRFQHLTPKMHKEVANLLKKSFDEYEPGKIIEYGHIQPVEEEKKIIKRLKNLF
jgi:hypothetical protein